LLLRKLVENQKFKFAFINRFADMLNTTFVAGSVISNIDSIAAIMQPEILRHYNRWNAPSPVAWETHVKTMRNFATNRVMHVQSHINQQFVRAGIFDLTLSAEPSAAGSIKLNTIEVSGNLWKGKYFENVPVSLTANVHNGYKFHHWEVNGVTMLNKTIEVNLKKATTVKAIFEDVVDDGNSVVINEINYNPSVENDAGDWVEIYNWGRVDLDISGWIFKDDDDTHQFAVPQNTILKSNEYLVLCKSSENFTLIHPNVTNKLGNFDFGLGSTGDAVRLYDKSLQLVDSVTFGSEMPWPVEPNGTGTTLELRQYFNDNTKAESWKSSVEKMGTPGIKNSITTGFDLLAGAGSEKQLLIYPNPFTTETRLIIGNNGFEPMKVQIYSMDGRLVRNDITTDNEYVWKGDNQSGHKLQPGIYICKVQADNRLFTGKIVLG
jgi:hypothetical protein